MASWPFWRQLRRGYKGPAREYSFPAAHPAASAFAVAAAAAVSTMLSARNPLAARHDQPRVSPKKSLSPMKNLSPMKGLVLSDKENTVSVCPPSHPPPGSATSRSPCRSLPAAPRAQQRPCPGQQDGPQDLPGERRQSGECRKPGHRGRPCPVSRRLLQTPLRSFLPMGVSPFCPRPSPLGPAGSCTTTARPSPSPSEGFPPSSQALLPQGDFSAHPSPSPSEGSICPPRPSPFPGSVPLSLPPNPAPPRAQPEPFSRHSRCRGAWRKRSRCCGRTPAGSSSSPSSTTTSGRCTRRPRPPSGPPRR